MGLVPLFSGRKKQYESMPFESQSQEDDALSRGEEIVKSGRTANNTRGGSRRDQFV
jgi:hypothetical protein